jgi:hypothetical protein
MLEICEWLLGPIIDSFFFAVGYIAADFGRLNRREE